MESFPHFISVSTPYPHRSKSHLSLQKWHIKWNITQIKLAGQSYQCCGKAAQAESSAGVPHSPAQAPGRAQQGHLGPVVTLWVIEVPSGQRLMFAVCPWKAVHTYAVLIQLIWKTPILMILRRPLWDVAHLWVAKVGGAAQGQCDVHNLPAVHPAPPSVLISFLAALNPISSARKHSSNQEMKLCQHAELPGRRRKLLVQNATPCYLGRENVFFTHFSLTPQAIFSPTPFFGVSALALQWPVFISHLLDFRSRSSQWNMALAQCSTVQSAWCNIWWMRASKAESRAKMHLPGFISLFLALLSVSPAPQLPEPSQVLMGTQQQARIASWIRGSWNSAALKTIFKGNFVDYFFPDCKWCLATFLHGAHLGHAAKPEMWGQASATHCSQLSDVLLQAGGKQKGKKPWVLVPPSFLGRFWWVAALHSFREHVLENYSS